MEKHVVNSEFDTSIQRVRYIKKGIASSYHLLSDDSQASNGLYGLQLFPGLLRVAKKKKPAIGSKECPLLREFRRTASIMMLFSAAVSACMYLLRQIDSLCCRMSAPIYSI